jgi:hypothetical protein
MKHLFVFTLLVITLTSYGEKIEKFDGGYNDWQTRKITVDIDDSLAISGSSYLAVYSEIYERNQHRT